MRIEDLFWIGFVGGGLSLLFAFLQLGRLLPLPVVGEPAQGLAAALSKGTNAYLKWQLLLSAGGLMLVAGLLAALAYCGLWSWLAPLALLSGGLCGLLVGAAGAKLTSTAGPRAAQAAGERLDRGVDAALTAGTVVSFLTVGLGLLHLTGWFFLLKYCMGYDAETIARTLLLFGLGSALVSLLFRMGSIFARGAGIAVETVDREMGLPPDDPKNPVAITDQVGHGVGAAADMGAGLFCTYEGVLFAALFWGQRVFSPADMGWNAMLLPLAVAAAGVFASLVGFLTVRPKERGDRYSLPWCLRFAALVPAVLTAVAVLPLTYFLMGNWTLCLPIFSGLAAGILIPLAGEYFTSDTYRPARSLAEAADSGTVTALTGGFGIGLCSSALPVLLTAAALAVAFWTAGGTSDFARGVYGIALAGVGMEAVSGMALASAVSGSVGDCAAHAAALTDAEEASRRRADNLAAIGASAANGGRCLSAMSTGVMGLVFLSHLAQSGAEQAPIAAPLLSGYFLGTIAVLLFLGLLLLAVRGTAKAVVLQARRQFQDNEELIDGSEAPDYAACESRCATRSLLGAILPILLALAVPAAAGFLLGPWGLAGLSGVLLTLSVPLSLFFSLSGGALSGARRYVESGRRGGRGSDCHRSLLTAERSLASLSLAAGPALLALARLTLVLASLCAALLSSLPG